MVIYKDTLDFGASKSKKWAYMELMQWVAFQNESRFKSWIADEACEWIQIGEPLKVESLAMPLVFAVPLSVMPAEAGIQNMSELTLDASLRWRDKWSVEFMLNRDDDTNLPAYESKISDIKMMAVFAEFSQSIHEIAMALGFERMKFEPGMGPSVFKLSLVWQAPETMVTLLRAVGLLQAGLEIIACVRGFKITEWQYHDIDIKNYVLQVSNTSRVFA
ncbi:MAG: hypothetical protein JKY15_03335 [Deltaproteobacteria bacterium]|nr:hypothetical protein [Deltaproteobacteria bacterium]